MKRLFASLFVLLICFVSALAQQPTASPTALPQEDQVVKINTDLIQIDVTVLDKDGKVVKDLSQQDFELYENGKLQKISNFSFVSKLSSGVTLEDGQQESPPSASTATQELKRANVKRTIALVVDDLNVSFAGIYYARKALLKFVDEQMQPGDLVAVIRTGGGVGALQQFTSNKEFLRAAIQKIRWNPFSSIDALSPIGQTDTEITERFNSESDQVASGNPKQYTLLHPHDQIDEIQKASKNSAKNQSAAAQAIYTQSSLGSLRYLIQGMRDLPGRKAMMYFSDGVNIGETMNNKSTA